LDLVVLGGLERPDVALSTSRRAISTRRLSGRRNGAAARGGAARPGGVAARPAAGDPAALLRGRSYDPWWLLLTLPVGLGFAFHWRLVNYLIATPIAIRFNAVALDYAGRPARRRGAALAALTLLLFWTHLIAFAAAMLIGAAVIAVSARAPAPGSGPAVAARDRAPDRGRLAAAQARRRRSDEVPAVLHYGWHRLAQLPAWLIGEPVGLASVLTGALLLPFAAGGCFALSVPRLAPLLCVLALYLFVPKDAFGTASLHPGFAVFVLSFLLLDLDSRRKSRPVLGAGCRSPSRACGW